jgi:hypothetical protein
VRLSRADAVVTFVVCTVVRMSLYLNIGRFSEYGLEPQACQRIQRAHLGSTLHVEGHFQLLAKYQVNRVIFHNAAPQPARKMNITAHRAARAFPFSVI